MLSPVSIFGLLICRLWPLLLLLLLLLLLQPLSLEALNLTSFLTSHRIMGTTDGGAGRQPSNAGRPIIRGQYVSPAEADRSEWSTRWRDPNELSHGHDQQFEDDDISFDQPKVLRTRKRTTTTTTARPKSLTQTKYFYFIHDPRKFPDFDMEESMPSRLSQDGGAGAGGDGDEDGEPQIPPPPPPEIISKASTPDRDDQVPLASSYGGYEGGHGHYTPPVKHQHKTIHIHTAPQAAAHPPVPHIQVYKNGHGKDKLWALILLAAFLPLLIGSLVLFPFLLLFLTSILQLIATLQNTIANIATTTPAPNGRRRRRRRHISSYEVDHHLPDPTLDDLIEHYTAKFTAAVAQFNSRWWDSSSSSSSSSRRP